MRVAGICQARYTYPMDTLTDTPLAKALRHLGITQVQLGAMVGVDQPRISRAVKHCRMKEELAGRILDAIDPDRKLKLNEGHLLLARRYPLSFGVWEAPRDVPRETLPPDRLGSAARSA